MAKSVKAKAKTKVQDAEVAEWVAKAPEIRGLRRPGTRMKAVALMQQMEAKGILKDPPKSPEGDDDPQRVMDGLADMAEFIADIDELLGTLGGAEYVDFIEKVPLDNGLQVAVLIEIFSQRIAPSLGKG